MAGKPLFRTSGQTGVTADDPPVRPDVQTPVHLEGLTPSRQDVQEAASVGAGTPERPDAGTPVRGGAEAARRTDVEEATVAFSWRQTPLEAMELDALVLELRRQLGGGRLDKKDLLYALVKLAKADGYVRDRVLHAIREAAA